MVRAAPIVAPWLLMPAHWYAIRASVLVNRAGSGTEHGPGRIHWESNERYRCRTAYCATVRRQSSIGHSSDPGSDAMSFPSTENLDVTSFQAMPSPQKLHERIPLTAAAAQFVAAARATLCRVLVRAGRPATVGIRRPCPT